MWDWISSNIINRYYGETEQHSLNCPCMHCTGGQLHQQGSTASPQYQEFLETMSKYSKQQNCEHVYSPLSMQQQIRCYKCGQVLSGEKTKKAYHAGDLIEGEFRVVEDKQLEDRFYE